MNEDVEALRAHLRMYDDGKLAHLADLPDETLADAIAKAKERIGGRRLSWKIVASGALSGEGRWAR